MTSRFWWLFFWLIHISPVFLLLAGVLLWPARAYSQDIQISASDSHNEIHVSESDFEAYLKDLRSALTPQACKALGQEEYMKNPVSGRGTDPRLFDASIYVIEHSTYPECYVGNEHDGAVWGLGSFINTNTKNHPKDWKKMGDALIKIVNESTQGENWKNEGWQNGGYAAKVLERMGPPYQGVAYNSFFIRLLKNYSDEQVITPNDQHDAMELIEDFYFRKFKDQSSFYKAVKRNPPIALFQAVNQKLKLVDCWGKYLQREKKISPKYIWLKKDEKMFLEFKRIINGPPPSIK
ncbi:MAG: hypothetical protein ACYCPQ_10495 [Elusimicrobiota bacterium]